MEHLSPLTIAHEGLLKAIAAVGSRAELARRLGISRPAVAQWSVVPINRVAAVASATGIPIEQLCPQLAPRSPFSSCGGGNAQDASASGPALSSQGAGPEVVTQGRP